MSDYLGISTQDALTIQGLVPTLSGAEMLKKDYPRISNALLKYASQLTENFLVLSPEPFAVKIFERINSMIDSTQIASITELENFGDKLISALNSNAPELERLAKVVYAATTIYQGISHSISEKILKKYPIPYVNPFIPNTQESHIQKTPVETQPPANVEKADAQLLAQISKESFIHKDYDISLTALTAAILELEKSL